MKVPSSRYIVTLKGVRGFLNSQRALVQRFLRAIASDGRMLVGLGLLASAPSYASAQTNPDLSNVTDILHGNHALYQITDLAVSSTFGSTLYQTTIFTSNSQQTNNPTSPAVSPVDPSQPPLTFSAFMFDQPTASTITVVRTPDLSGFGETTSLYAWNVPIDPVVDAEQWFPLSTGDATEINLGVVADFTQDGYDDIALGLADGRLLVGTPVSVTNGQPGLRTNITNLDVLQGMTTGDFAGDGNIEIAGITAAPDGGEKLVIYAVDPTSLAVTRAASLVLTTPGASTQNPIAYVSLTHGRFNTLTHDQLGVAFATTSGSTTVEVIDFPASSLTPREGPAYTASSVTIPGGYLQLQNGKFGQPADPYDQLVFHMSSESSGGRFFEVLSVDAVTLALKAHSGITYDAYPCSAGVQIGNFDNQQPDPTNPGQNEHNINQQVAFLYCDGGATKFLLNIYNVDPSSWNIVGQPVSVNSNPAPSGFSLNTKFVPADLQGRSMVLGNPTKYTIDGARPTIVTAAPPMHIDYIKPYGATKPEVFNISYAPDGFNSSFSLSQTSKTGGSTTHKTSWSAGIDLSTSVYGQIGDPDMGTGTKFGGAFHVADELTSSSDNQTVNYSSTQFDVTTGTKTGDVVFYDDSRQNIWSYPVIGAVVCPATVPATPNCPDNQKVPLTMQFSAPDQILPNTPISDDLPSVFWFQPPWEFGNIFSYPATQAQLTSPAFYPNLAPSPLSTDTSFFTDNATKEVQATWSSGSEQGSTASLANTTNFDVSASYVNSIGIEGFGKVKVKTSLKLSGSAGFGVLRTNTASVDASNGIGIKSVALFADPFYYNYQVSPVILGNQPPAGVGDATQPPLADIQTFGPLKTAYLVDPINAGAWWTRAYGQLPDVGLNHPSRWVLTEPELASPVPDNCKNTGTGSSQMDCADIGPYTPSDPWLSQFHSMRGFFITRGDSPGAGPQLGFANAGDKLDLAVRVYNYSLASMPSGTVVHVRFYGIPWDVNNQAPLSPDNSFLIGESTAAAIPPFNDVPGSGSDPGSPLNWTVVHLKTPFDTTPYAKQTLTFWVVVWMQNGNTLVPEIEGHGLTAIPGTLKSLVDVPVEMTTDLSGNPASYSNNVGFYHYAFPIFAPPSTGLGAAANNPADVKIDCVTAAKDRIIPGEIDEVSATLQAGSEGATGLKVYFYDKNPSEGGTPIAVEPASVSANSRAKVRIPFHVNTSGNYHVWAVVNLGKPYQTEGHTHDIAAEWHKKKKDTDHDWDGGN